MAALVPPGGPASSGGGHWADEDSRSNHQLSLLNLPGEVILKVLDQLRPTDSVTSFRSTSKRPDVSRDFFQSRASLTNVVLVSRLFYQLGSPYLYRTIILSNQIEVLRFFCTLAKHPHRRLMVRSLAWLTVLSTDDTNKQSTMLRQSQADSIAADCWDSIKDYWPQVTADCRIAHIMGIVDSSSFETWRLLGAILALCPRIASLFLLHGIEDATPGVGLPYSPEVKALSPLLWDFGEVDDPGNSGGPRPSCHGFLAELQHLIVEAHEDPRSHNYARFLVFLFLTNSPRLRRVEIKGSVVLRGIWACFKQYPHSRLLADKVKELVLLRTEGPWDDMLATVMAFPRLVSLQAEYDDASYRASPHSSNLTFTISSALLMLADTLETVSLTTGPTSYGHWSYIENYPPTLTSLHQMGKLKDLTTESMWLFGRQDISIALQLPQLLPPNLVCFRLIDYWGTTHTTPPDYHPDSLKYHPDFPSGWNTAEFYYNVLITLVGDNSPPIPDLREVTLVSKHLCEELQPGDSGGEQGQAHPAGSSEELLSKLRALFRALGIQFTLEMPVESTAAARENWARIG